MQNHNINCVVFAFLSNARVLAVLFHVVGEMIVCMKIEMFAVESSPNFTNITKLLFLYLLSLYI